MPLFRSSQPLSMSAGAASKPRRSADDEALLKALLDRTRPGGFTRGYIVDTRSERVAKTSALSPRGLLPSGFSVRFFNARSFSTYEYV